MFERRGPSVAALRPVSLEQPRGKITSAQTLQVHREERDVAEDVAIPQPIIEFEAIEEPRPAGEAEHVVGEQVAVTVADSMLGDPLAEERAAAAEVPERVAFDTVDDPIVERALR